MENRDVARARPKVFVMHRAATIGEFLCGWCRKPKTSKLRFVGTTDAGDTLTICNGCHGQLLAESK